MPESTLQPTHPAIRPLLKRLGLNEREIAVYLALLPMKIARATDIAEAAKQSRSHTYIVLRELEKKGLISEMERGKILHFVAESPDRLLSYLKDREYEIRELEQLVEGAIPFLSSLTKPLEREPRVTILFGLEGAKQTYRDILTRPFRAFFNPEINWEAFGGNIVTMLFGKGAKLRGKELFVNNEAARKYIEEVPPHEEYEIRLLPKEINFRADVVIFEDEVHIFTLGDRPATIRIENPSLAQAMQQIHEVMWNLSEKVGLECRALND